MSKTPRTLVEDYIDASKTQTVKVLRNKHVGLVRTPDLDDSNQARNTSRSGSSNSSRIQSPSVQQRLNRSEGSRIPISRTPDPYIHSGAKSRPQHDRVSSLRSKRRSVSSNDVEETPRQLLQGFLESEDTTAPLVRYKSRTSHDRMSSSQPPIQLDDRRSSVSRPGNWTINVDYDTPRTLLQNYALYTTPAYETPAQRQVQRTPEILISRQDRYETPSPFKTNIVGSEDIIPESVRGRTPRSVGKRRGNFSIGTVGDIDESLDEDVIPPTNPADYEVPSPFRTSSDDEDSVVAETVYSNRSHNQRSRGHFNISVPDDIQEEISIYRQSQKLDRDNRSIVQSQARNSSALDNQSRNRSDVHNQYENQSVVHNQSANFEDEGNSGDESGPEYSYLPETSRLSMKKQETTTMLPDGMEYTMPLNDNEMETSPVISHKGRRNSFQPEEELMYTDGSDRMEDVRRTGRWSEGHRSRLVSLPSEVYEGSEGSRGRRMSLPEWSSQQQESPYREQRLRHSVMNREPELLADREDTYFAEKVDNLTIQNISNNFSPRMTSTQRMVTMETNYDDDQSSSAVTPSPVVSPDASPRSQSPSSSRLSTSKLTPSTPRTSSVRGTPSTPKTSKATPTTQRISSDRLTPSTPRSSSNRPQSSTPNMSMARNMTNTQSNSRVLTPSQRDNISPSSTTSNRSSVSRSSSRHSGSRVSTSANSSRRSPAFSSNRRSTVEQASSRALTPSVRSRNSSNIQEQDMLDQTDRLSERSRSSVHNTSGRSPAASPVVASRKSAPDMMNTLPNNTANFSPPIASTQNIEAISRVGQKTVEKMESLSHVGEKTLENIATLSHAKQKTIEKPSDRIDNISDEDLQVEMETGYEDNELRTTAHVTPAKTTEPVKKKTVRKPRQKACYSIPVNVVKKQFSHFAGLRVSKEAIEEVMKVSEKYWDILAGDLEAYAKHAGRKQINMSDFVLLFKRQGHVTEKQSLKSLIEKYLPMEERVKLIPVARAGNRIEPKL